jgi:hypothetical protein
MTKPKRNTNDLILVLSLIIVVSLTALAALLGIYKLVISLSPTVLRVWAVLATAALPLVGWSSWHVSRHVTKTEATLEGLDKGIEKVMGAAQRTADVRDRSAAMSRVARAHQRTNTPANQLTNQAQFRKSHPVDVAARESHCWRSLWN